MSTSPERSGMPARFDGQRVVELDVRDDLRNGREPFARIMATVEALGPTDVLHLRATFEPVPLVRVMARRGYEHVAEEEGSGDWSVWFHRAAHTTNDASGAATATVAAVRESEPPAALREIVLDVRGLEPPEPMVRTLVALEALPPGTVLVQHNERVPHFLFPILNERGFRYDVDESAPDVVIVRIRTAG